MKQILITIAAVVLVGCGTTQPPKPPTAKAPDISIQEAARTGNIEAVKTHLAAGTDVDWFDEPVGRLGHSVVIDKTTALHYAVFGGQKDVAEILIANGADVNAKNFQSKSPLDFAVKYKQPELADLLRKHGAKTGEELKAEVRGNTSYSQQSQP